MSEGFPNLLMITGPGSRSVKGNMINSIEQHVKLVTETMTTINGLCHCGNLQATLTTQKKPQEMWLRACQCAFCRSHDMRSLSDPEGRMEIRVKDESQLNRYHFGLGIVDFLICRNCGNYIGAVQAVDGQLYGVMNANLTEGRGAAFGEAEHRFYEGETGEERSARRQKVWTPATLVIEG